MLKTITIEGLSQPVVLARRKGTKSLRLSIKSDGQVRVSVPYGVPELFARQFVTSKVSWIQKHQKKPNHIPQNAHIGKNHRLVVRSTAAARHHTTITDTGIIVTLPETVDMNSSEAQKIIKSACDKALIKQAKILLPQRLATIAKQKNISYKSCSIKKLKSRWGACDNHGNITLNSYLIQLDWTLIDYVICHELAHTIHHHHQKSFWDLVMMLSPHYKDLRKSLKNTPTDVIVTMF